MKIGCVNYSYLRPARRSWGKVILPRMVSPEVHASIVLDTSVSMGANEIGQALAETKAICRAVGTDPTVLFVDSEVCGKGKAGRNLASKVVGGGGTNMGRGIEAAVEDRPDVIIVLTDGYTPWPKKGPRVPVVVGIIGQQDVGTMYTMLGEGETPSWAQRVDITL
jgi:predicted metal-dependent peptidase